VKQLQEKRDEPVDPLVGHTIMHVNNLRRNRKMAVQKNACLEIIS
jgi:hypothetical protein